MLTIYGGITADSCYNCTVNLTASHFQTEHAATEEVKALHVQKTNTSDINYSNLCFVGWRLLVGYKQLNSCTTKILAAAYYKGHICVVCNNSESTENTIHCLRLRTNCTPLHCTIPTRGRITGLSSTDGQLFFCTDEGALWLLSDIVKSSPQRLLLSNRKVRQVDCGKEHAVILTTLGQVYTYGGGSRGQLGHGCLESVSEPKAVEALSGIYAVCIRAGGWHTLVLSGDVYGWGWNESGQVGVACLKDEQGLKRSSDYNGHSMVVYPSLLFEDDEDITIIDISCGSRHSAAVTDYGKLYTWGWNGYGQLLMDMNICLQDSPKLISTDDKKFKGVKCGGWTTVACYSSEQRSDNSEQRSDNSDKR